jgi:hypothetical protein
MGHYPLRHYCDIFIAMDCLLFRLGLKKTVDDTLET